MHRKQAAALLRRRAKAGSIKVLFAVASQERLRAKLGWERVAAFKTSLPVGDEVLGKDSPCNRWKKHAKGDKAAWQEESEEEVTECENCQKAQGPQS